jgi:hypothetical protein
VAPDRAFEATTPGAVEAALHGHEGPVLLAAPDVPALGTHHAAAALADLGEGSLLSVAPSTDGRPFLVALPRLDLELLELAVGPFESLAAATLARGGGVGLVRSERRLVSPGDARAVAADPLAPPGLAAVLRRAMPVRRPPR